MILKRIFVSAATALVLVCGGCFGAQAKVHVVADTVTASDAFVRMPAQTLDLLSTSMRLDLLEYLRHDSIYKVPNTLEGLSELVPPVTADYLKVKLSPVTEFTVRILPGKKEQIIGTAYTVGDSLQAHDTALQFFTPSMQPIKLDKIIKIASSEDFLDTHGLSHDEREKLLYYIPFPTVEYIFSPDGTELTARLTVGEFLGKEVNEKLAPYLHRERIYRWDGHKYKMAPEPKR